MNYSVFCYETYVERSPSGEQKLSKAEIKEWKEKAMDIAKTCIEGADAELKTNPTLEKQKLSESNFILDFLRQNLVNWRKKCKKVSNSKKNLFSQQDSEA